MERYVWELSTQTIVVVLYETSALYRSIPKPSAAIGNVDFWSLTRAQGEAIIATARRGGYAVTREV